MNYITMRRFGSMGRWANQLFQYAFCRDYADAHDLELQLPSWVGQELFGIQTPPVSVSLPRKSESYDSGGQPIPPRDAEFVNTDFVGWAQFHTKYVARYKSIWWNSFRPVEAVMERLADATDKFADMGKTKIGIHIRRGDYGQNEFYITPIAWYLRWLEQYWDTFDAPVLFVASEDPTLVSEFMRYNPLTTKSFGVDLRAVPMANYNYLERDLATKDEVQLDFYPDFYLLSQCDVLVAPNSTFSFAAGLTNPNLKRFFRSGLPHGGFIEENIWDCYPLQHDKVTDYPHLEGIKVDANPYW